MKRIVRNPALAVSSAFIVALAAMVLLLAAGVTPAGAQTFPGPGDDPRSIVVKFNDDLRPILTGGITPANRSLEGLPTPAAVSLVRELTLAGGGWTRMSGASMEETDRITYTASRNLGRQVARLNNYFILTVPEDADAGLWIDRLRSLAEVELALFTPRPVPAPVPGSFQSRQGYLNAAVTGIDAAYAWSLGDTGQGVTVCDLEYSWNLSHQDLPPSVTTLTVPGWTAVDPYLDQNHGTAALGELAAVNNGWGTTGAAYGASFAVAPTNFSSFGWQLGTAMTYAMTQLSPGDVFLIEQQYAGPKYQWIPGNDSGLIPIEWYRPWYDVVVAAVGNGFHVVEAAGNGYEDLDSAVYSTGNGGHWPFLPQNNSGALIVGAGAVPSSFYGTDTARSRLNFSNYGSRLDLQGWGEFVVTTGYGGLHSSEGVNLYFDSSFAGTSSASPIVAAAVALVESRFETVYGGAMAPGTMRTLLKSTGTPQQSGSNPLSQAIGPLPDLNGALAFGSYTLPAGTYQVGLSRTYVDLGAVAAALTGNILTGNVVFELQSDYFGALTETFPIVFTPWTSSSGSWSVTIRPAAGVTSRLTSGSPPPFRPVLQLDGADGITFDGRAGGSGPGGDWIIRNTRTDSTGPSVLFCNGADNNVLTFLQVESQCSTAGTGTIQFGRSTDVLPDRNNAVTHNVVCDRTDIAGAPQIAISSLPLDGAAHDSNRVTANQVFNWRSVGINLVGERWTVDSNSIFEVAAQSGALTGITLQGGNGHLVADNYIGGSGPQAGGSALAASGSAPFTGIALSVDTAAPTLVERNVIRNILLSSTGFANFFGISGQSSGRMTIRRNVVGDSVAGGMVYMGGTGVASGISLQFVNGAAVEDNLIAGIRQTFSSPGEMRCINLNSPNMFSIARNRIHTVGPVMTGIPGLVRGIYLDTFIDSVLIANNMISIGFGDTNDVRYDGIYDASMTGALRVFIGHNSVSLGGISQFSAGSGGVNHAGMSPIQLRNNAISNLRSGGGGFHQTLLNSTPSWFPGASDNNVLYNLNPVQLTGWLGAPLSLAGWVSATLGDIQSVNADPMFLNPPSGDLHIDPTVFSPADNAGVPLATITDDFDGGLRQPAPDIGADEYTIAAPGAFALLLPANNAANRPVSDTLRWAPSAAAGLYEVYLDTLTPPVAQAGSGLTDTLFAYASIDTNRDYYWSVIARNSSGGVPAAGSPWKFTTGPVSGEITGYYAVEGGWNMVSVPMEVSDVHWMSLYPLAVSKAYGYSGGYVSAESLAVGTGYWVKFSDTGTVALTGEAVDRETVAVEKGWNIIGSVTDPVTVSSIVSIPGGLVTSQFYGYSGAYQAAGTVEPGEAYWIKASDSGRIVITTDTLSAEPSARLTIEAIGELPPSPPELPAENDAPVPERFSIGQNYPNPFNATTTIRIALPEGSIISLKIHDLLGREICTLAEGYLDAGIRLVRWDGTDDRGRPVGSGMYVARFQAVPASNPGASYRGVLRLMLIN